MDCAHTDAPPQPRKLKVRLDGLPDGFAFRLWNPQLGLVAFLFLWLIGWTVGCIFLGIQVWNDPQLGMVLFGIPFWISWFFVAAFIIYCLTMHESFCLDQQGVTFYRQAVIVLLRREIPLAELREFSTYEEVQKSDESTTTTYGIELRGQGRSLRFAANLSEAERTWLCYELQATLRQLQAEDHRGLALADTDPDEDDSQYRGRQESAPAATDLDVAQDQFILEAADTPLQPPSDSAWRLSDDIQTVRFAERGRLSLMMVLGMAFICTFWNGIVSVFLCVLWGVMPGAPPQGVEWWGMFVFLIPFEAIGLLMVVGLIFTLLEPVRTTSWTFSPDHIRCRMAWLGLFGWSWNYASPDYGRLKVIDLQTDRKQFVPTIPGDTAGMQSALVVVDPDNVEICTITRLSLGEARWMADVLLQNHPDWFAR